MKNLLRLFALLLPAVLWSTPDCNAETKRILAVGNSFSYDAILQELLPVVRSGGDDILVGFPYKGGTTLELHWQYITGKEQIYNYYKIANGKTTSTGGASRCFDKDIITSEPWDVVVIQTDHNYGGAYDHYFPYLDNIIAYLRENLTNKDAKFYLYMTWGYQDGSTKILELINKGLYTDQADQYAKITDCAQRAAVQSGIGLENIIPAGTAIQNGRTSYIGDAYNRDGYHLDLLHGRYTASLTWYAKIFGKSPFDVTYRPADMSDFCAKMCKTAVAKAIETPFSVSSLQEEFGLNPDATFNVIDRPVYVNFGLSSGNTDAAGNVWNSLTTHVTGASLRRLFNNKGYVTDICVTVEEAFDGVASGGNTYLGNGFDMPAEAAKSSFYGHSKSAIMISGLYPGQSYDMNVYASATDGESSTFRFIGSNEALTTLNPCGNSDKFATASSIIADDRGHIKLEVGAANGGTYHINTLAIVPHLSVPGKKAIRINFTSETDKEAGWNNVYDHVAGTTLADLSFSDGTSSGISMKVTKSFAGTTTSGATSTETMLEMPAAVSSTGFWVNGVEKDGVLSDCGEIVFEGFDADLLYDIHIFGSQTGATEVYEAEYSTFGKTDNFIALNCNDNSTQTATLPGIGCDANGKIRFTVTPGATSEDRYKEGFINAMVIMVPAMIEVSPFEPVAMDPWDGKSVVQPTTDAAGNYIVYCGAELAWIAERVNNGSAVSGVKLASDIDLGNKPWTPIGYGVWFNGNFDGQGYHIRNLYINKSDLTGNTHFCGLIGGTNDVRNSIKNLYLSGKIEIPTTMAAKALIGSLVGKANNIGSISNIHSEMEYVINGTPGYVGGLIGFMKTAEVKNCSFTGSITINGAVTNGIGGICGCTNSSVAGVEAVFNGCYFDGTIMNKGSKAPKYVGGINGYSNITAGSETITNNYIAGLISTSGNSRGIIYGTGNTPSLFCGNNFYVDDFGYRKTGGEKGAIEDFHSGKIAYTLNGDHSEMLFGQNLDESDSMPVVYTGANHVYKVEFTVDGEPYATVYCNATLRLPAPPTINGKVFEGWEDAAGNIYTETSVICTDLKLSAKMSAGIDVIPASENNHIEVYRDILKIYTNNYPCKLRIFTPDGKTLMSRTIVLPITEFDISHFQHGAYITAIGAYICKFIK